MSAAAAFARINAERRLPFTLQHVALDDYGAIVAGQGASSAHDTTVLWCHQVALAPAFFVGALASLPSLRYVHSDLVGLEHLALDGFLARGITLTNGVGTPSRPVAEWVLLSLLAWVKHYPAFVRRSDGGRWERTPELSELAGKRVLLSGLGSIGRLVAAMLAPFAVETIAVVERERSAPEPNVARVVRGNAWRAELAHADAVVLTLPATTATVGMFDAATLGMLKPSVCLVNVSRGSLIDEDALADALDSGRIGFAALDAFSEEPLPAASRLWGRPNVVVSPHYSWNSDAIVARAEALFCANLVHYHGREALENPIDVAFELARLPR